LERGSELLAFALPDVDVPDSLRRSEARFHGVFEQSPLGGLIIDGALRILQSNAAFQALVGRDAEELVGTGALDLSHVDDRDRCRREVARLFSGEVERFQMDKRYLCRDGSDIPVRLTASLVRDEWGEPLYGIGLVEDISEAVFAAATITSQQERLAMALHAGDLAVWELDLASGAFTMWDNAAVIYGIHSVREAPTFTDFLEVVVEEDRHLFLTPPPPVDEPFSFDYRIHHAGDVAWLRSQGRTIGDEQGRTVALRGTTVDITAARQAEAQRAEAAAVHRETLQAVPDAFVGTDGAGRVTDWNPAAETMFGWGAEEILDTPLVDAIFPRDDRATYQDRIEALSSIDAEEVPPGRIEVIVQHRDGRTFPAEASIVVVRVDGEPRLRAFIRDITDRRAYERDLTDRVLVDHLTGLPNRTLLADRLGRAIARAGARDVFAAVLFIDVDRLASINESLGHTAGDAVLVAVAARLRDVVGPLYTVARHGGDDFIVLCEDLPSPEDAERIAERILASFASPLAVTGRRLTVGLSIGLAAVTSAQDEPDALIRDADVAMQQAKALGGGRVEILESAAPHRMSGRLDLEQELRRALASHQVTVAYQPVVTLDGRLVSMEALARWEHAERGAISPAEFIPVAEETGLIVDLGAQVLDVGCARLAAWRRKPGWERLTLAVNLSGRQLVEPDLVSTVDGILRSHGLPVDAICLEITESMLMDEGSQAASTVDELADMGVVLSVDDFGTGFSSLLYLRRFPVHALKLDRSFVSGIGRSEVDTAIVGSMIDLAHSLHLVAVAEGVETASQAAALRARGCDLAQGYLFSRPVPAAEFTELLDQPRFR
jgi:diguanylate cyclase (GGDEF)-like protein/PAS domain S-box-containing protein